MKRKFKTMDAERVNTRTKDLIDMVLLISGEKLDKGNTAAAVRNRAFMNSQEFIRVSVFFRRRLKQ
jgi:hypothetical protein